MKAIVQDGYGSADSLRVGDIARPAPGPGQLLVRVQAASVNARDWHLMRGDPYLARLAAPGTLGLRRPTVPVRGTDFAGAVVEVGPGVTRFRIGDEVFGEADGAFAEYVCAPQDHLAQRPANLTAAQAAALPLAANTALIAVRDAAQVRALPGRSGREAAMRVLVNGAAGGVGLFAVQLAHSYGATVTGVCSTGNIELVRSMGATEVVDYTEVDFTRTGPYDVLIDLVGNRSLRELRRAVTPDGTLVLSGGGVFRGGSLIGPMGLVIRGALAARFVRQRIVVPDATPSPENLATIRDLASAGVLIPIIDRTLPLAEAAAAIGYVETGHARGKVVLLA